MDVAIKAVLEQGLTQNELLQAVLNALSSTQQQMSKKVDDLVLTLADPEMVKPANIVARANEMLLNKPVMCTTNNSGVFAGILLEYDPANGLLLLKDGQAALYFEATMRGAGGLAAFGPDNNTRIGPPVNPCLIVGVDTVQGITEDAYKKWLQQPWKPD